MKISRILASGAVVGLVLAGGVSTTASAASTTPTPSSVSCKTSGVGTPTGGAYCSGTAGQSHRAVVKCSDGSTHYGAWKGNKEWSYATCAHPQAVTSVSAQLS